MIFLVLALSDQWRLPDLGISLVVKGLRKAAQWCQFHLRCVLGGFTSRVNGVA